MAARLPQQTRNFLRAILGLDPDPKKKESRLRLEMLDDRITPTIQTLPADLQAAGAALQAQLNASPVMDATSYEAFEKMFKRQYTEIVVKQTVDFLNTSNPIPTPVSDFLTDSLAEENLEAILNTAGIPTTPKDIITTFAASHGHPELKTAFDQLDFLFQLNRLQSDIGTLLNPMAATQPTSNDFNALLDRIKADYDIGLPLYDDFNNAETTANNNFPQLAARAQELINSLTNLQSVGPFTPGVFTFNYSSGANPIAAEVFRSPRIPIPGFGVSVGFVSAGATIGFSIPASLRYSIGASIDFTNGFALTSGEFAVGLALTGDGSIGIDIAGVTLNAVELGVALTGEVGARIAPGLDTNMDGKFQASEIVASPCYFQTFGNLGIRSDVTYIDPNPVSVIQSIGQVVTGGGPVEKTLPLFNNVLWSAEDKSCDPAVRGLAAIGNVVNGVLQVNGTSGDDTINVSREKSDPAHPMIVVTNNGAIRSFLAAEIVLIEINTFAGNDRATIEQDVTIKAVIDGGDDNDTIRGGGGNDIIRGGKGDDFLEEVILTVGTAEVTIRGSNGDDFVFGGEGADHISGGGTGFDIIEGEAGDDVVTVIDIVPAIVDGGDNNDTLTIDYKGQGSRAIRYDGGAGSDQLIFSGGDPGHFRGQYDIGIDGDEGTVTYSDGAGHQQYVQFVGLEPIIDIMSAAELTINASAGNDTVNIVDGALFMGVNTSKVDFNGAFEEISFGNKEKVIVNADSGADTISLNLALANRASGLLALEVNGDTGNDSFTLTNTGGAVELIVRGGVGNDVLNGSAIDATQELHLIGGAGDDSLTGGFGSDRLEGNEGRDTLVGGQGSDTVLGGADSDVIVYNAEDGADTLDGGIGIDIFQVVGTAGADNASLYADDSSASGQLRFAFRGFFSTISDFEIADVRFQLGADTLVVDDLGTTTVKNVLYNQDSGPDGSVDVLIINGTSRSENYSISRIQDPFGGSLVETVATLWGRVGFWGANVGELDGDRIEINAGAGDDTITASPDVDKRLILRGEGGNDFLSASGTLLGGANNDTLIGGAGNDSLQGGDGNDTLVRSGGADTLDGGAGFDTLVVDGTGANDFVDVVQVSGTALVSSLNGTSKTDTLVLGTVEEVHIEAGAGSDVIRVRTNDTLRVGPAANVVGFTVSGGPDSAGDRLLVVDHSVDDLVLYQKGPKDDAGVVTVGPANAAPFVTAFDEIETVQFIDDVGNALPNGNVVVFQHDSYESNDTRNTATHLGAGTVINLDSVINPGGLTNPFGDGQNLSGDADWFRFVAQETGTLDVTAFFHEIDQIGTRPGLPGGGNLDIRFFDSKGNLLATSAGTVDNERLVLPVVDNQVYFLQVFGVAKAINNYTLTGINISAPIPALIDLQAGSDTGRNDADDVTNDRTPTFDITLDDDRIDAFQLIDLIPDKTNDDAFTANTDYVVEVFNNSVSIGFAFYTGVGNTWRFTAKVGDLSEGHDNHITAAVRIRDRATQNVTGRGLLSRDLNVTLDTTAPAIPTINIDPRGEDTGVRGNAATLSDRVTSDTRTAFTGQAEANAIVRLFADGNSVSKGVLNGSDLFQGLTTAGPLSGDESFPQGSWQMAGRYDLNDARRGFPLDGHREIGATSEDLAGNVSKPGFLDIFLDTRGPQVTNVKINSLTDTYNLFDIVPTSDPTPVVRKLVISFRDRPERSNVDPNFLYPALDTFVASQFGQYQVVGDHVGKIPIFGVKVLQDPRASGTPATAHVFLDFDNPKTKFVESLPDDRYTLTLQDTLVDPAGNKLDGESNTAEPLNVPLFPSGDGQVGGDFTARFTIDTRPEIGTWGETRTFIDINGNGVYDPQATKDAANRDLNFKLGLASDSVFAGNFQRTGSAKGSVFDKVGAYGKENGSYRFLLDTNADGVPDLTITPALQLNGTPVAGNFSTKHRGDEIGLFDGKKWYLDSNGNNNLDSNDRVIGGSMRGLPIVGDFDGDGKDDLATFQPDRDRFEIDLALNGLTGNADSTIAFGFPGVRERPVAADMDQDGVDDLGVFVPASGNAAGLDSPDWYFLISHGKSTPGSVSQLKHAFKPTPLGNDLHFSYGNGSQIPLVGNFDPPISSAEPKLVTQTGGNTKRDVSITADVRIAVPNSNAGLFARFSPEKQGYWAGIVHDDGEFKIQIRRLYRGNWQTLASRKIQDGSGRLRFEVKADTLTVLLDGVEQGKVHGTLIRSGTFGRSFTKGNTARVSSVS